MNAIVRPQYCGWCGTRIDVPVATLAETLRCPSNWRPVPEGWTHAVKGIS